MRGEIFVHREREQHDVPTSGPFDVEPRSGDVAAFGGSLEAEEERVLRDPGEPPRAQARGLDPQELPRSMHPAWSRA
jgi:hypothetical protein